MGGRPEVEAVEEAVVESHRVYDREVTTIEEIDDKAMRSVRTSVLTLGILASATGLASSAAGRALTVATLGTTALGVTSLFISIVAGIGVYTVTRYPSGIGRAHREDLIEQGWSREQWAHQMVSEYGNWIEEVERNRAYLEVVQGALALGIFLIVVAAAGTVTDLLYGVRPGWVVVGALFLVTAVLVATATAVRLMRAARKIPGDR